MAKKIDIIQHVLIPKFSKLSEDEKKHLLDSFNISLLQLPTILAKDVLSKSVDAQPDDVIKIERSSQLGKAPYYRRVID